jgi:hypothetical protein
VVASRRAFLTNGILTLGGASLGVISISACSSSSTKPAAAPTPSAGAQSVALDWQVEGLNNSAAYAYFNVARGVTLNGIVIDAALTPASNTGVFGTLQTHCRACVARGSGLSSGQSVSTIAGTSPDFGSVLLHNPSGIAAAFDEAVLQNVFCSVILKSTVSDRGVSCATHRSVGGAPLISLRAEDLLVFEIVHSGLPGNLGIEAVLSYS